MSSVGPSEAFPLHRDVNVVFPEILGGAYQVLQDRLWPKAEELREAKSIADEDILKSAWVFRKIADRLKERTEAGYDPETPVETLRACGWFDLPPDVHLLVLAAMGQSLLVRHIEWGQGLLSLHQGVRITGGRKWEEFWPRIQAATEAYAAAEKGSSDTSE